MATKQSTIEYLVEQLSSLPAIRYRKMFGEYALYCNGKVVAFVCDDKLYIKPTIAGKNFLENIEEAPPYPGAKNYYYISGDLWEEREWLEKLIELTANDLPLPKKKR
jgi:TfoX/Sxy family transcriptional regulator of competence genes